MKRNKSFLFVASCLLLMESCSSPRLDSESPTQSGIEVPYDAATPTGEMALLADFEGLFELTGWETRGQDQRAIFEGTIDSRWILSGVFMETRVEGGLGDALYQAFGIIGYDQEKGRFMSTALTNAKPSPSYWGWLAGDFDEEQRTLTFPSTSGRSVRTIVDQDHWVLEMYRQNAEGEEHLGGRYAARRIP